MAAEMLLVLGDRTFSNPAMRAELLGLLREMLHLCVRLAFRIDAKIGNATLAAVAEVTAAWDAEEAALPAATPSNATDATEIPDAAAMAAYARTLILAAALAAGQRRRGRVANPFGAVATRRNRLSAVMAPPRPASGRAPPDWGGSSKPAWCGNALACP